MSKNKLVVKKMVTWEQAYIFGNDITSDKHEAVFKEYAKENEIKLYGDEHQKSDVKGVPMFTNGDVMTYTMRAWGRLMSEVWGGNYMDWYMRGFKD